MTISKKLAQTLSQHLPERIWMLLSNGRLVSNDHPASVQPKTSGEIVTWCYEGGDWQEGKPPKCQSS